MRKGVGLPPGEDRDPSLLPDLIRVFREVQQSDSTPFATQLYFNSWFILSLFDNPDVTVQLALRGRPGIVRHAYDMSQAALQPDAYFKFLSPDQETHDILDTQKTLLRYALRKIEQNARHVPAHIFSRAQIAVAFNDYTDAQRESRRAARTTSQDGKPSFVHHAGPFIPAHVSAHLMAVMGERLGRACKTAHLESEFGVHCDMVSASVPLYHDVHEAGERTTHRAISALRLMHAQMNIAISERNVYLSLPRAQDGEEETPERHLLKELMDYTKIYRSAAMPAPKPLEQGARIFAFPVGGRAGQKTPAPV